MAIAEDRRGTDHQFAPIHLAACIELARLEGRGPALAPAIEPSYFAALGRMRTLCEEALTRPWPDRYREALQGCVAAFTGRPDEARMLFDADCDDAWGSRPGITVTADFHRKTPKEACGKALMQAICKKLKDPAGRIRAEDLITTLASITGELCQDATGFLKSRDHPLRPGHPVFSDVINKVFCGDGPNLEAMPAESVVGIVRDRILSSGYRAAEFPDFKVEIFEYFAANATKNLGNRAPVSVPTEHAPRVHSMAAAYEARPIVDQAFAQLGSDAKSRVRAAAHALAEGLIAVKDVLSHKVALLLALQTVNATAKKAPMTDAAMEAFKKGQVPRPSPPTGTAP